MSYLTPNPLTKDFSCSPASRLTSDLYFTSQNVIIAIFLNIHQRIRVSNSYIAGNAIFAVSSSFERPTWDEYFMLQAELAKLRSNCMTRHVGAVIVRNHRQIATGYNGTPPGIKNCFEGGCKRCQLRMEGKIESGASLDRCLCNHAEANAIMHCAILGIEAGSDGAILYTTFVPCLECTKMAITIGIKKIVCLDTYPETDYDLIEEAGVKVITLEKTKIEYWAKKLIEKYNEKLFPNR